MNKKAPRVLNQLSNVKCLPDSKRSPRVPNQLSSIKCLPDSKRSISMSMETLTYWLIAALAIAVGVGILWYLSNYGGGLLSALKNIFRFGSG